MGIFDVLAGFFQAIFGLAEFGQLVAALFGLFGGLFG